MAGATAHQRVEETRRKKVKAGTRIWVRAAASLLLSAAMLSTGTRALDDLETLQKRFDRETDGVHKAKLLQKLGDAQFDLERNAARSGDYVVVGLQMEKYRDNVRSALQALKKTHPDAERHVSGYRELEMHTGRGLREIRDVILTMPEPYRPPMQLVEQDLLEIDNELLRLIFPRRPGEKPPLQQGASNPPKAEKPPDKHPPEQQP
jgi:hypothetical protein